MLKLNDGFTLLELLVSVSVVAIILTTAAPSLSQFIQNRQLEQQTSFIANSLSTARSIALSKAAATSVCWNASNATIKVPGLDNSFDLGVGQMVVIDSSEATSDDRIKNQTDFLTTGYNFVSNFTAGAAGTAQCVTFDSQGRSTTPGSFAICNAEGQEADSVTIQLSINGRSTQLEGNQVTGINCV